MCAADEDVQFWQQTVDALKAEHGANAECDALVGDNQDIDAARYLRGSIAVRRY
jgi:hypothetical protein